MTGSRTFAPIVCAIDSRFVVAACVLMQSLADSQPALARLCLIVLHEDLSPSELELLERHGRRLGLPTQLIKASAVDDAFPVSARISRATYLRLQIGDLLPGEQQVLYLDADMLVRRDLTPLLCRPIDDKPLAAVVDATDPVLGYSDALPGWRCLGLPATRQYFNAGLMLLNLAASAETKLFKRAREFLLERPDSVRFHDQDALNWAAEDNWTRLDPVWNAFTMSTIAVRYDFVHRAEPILPLQTLIALESEAAILHFSGRNKPWQRTCPDGVSTRLFRRLLARVPELAQAAEAATEGGSS